MILLLSNKWDLSVDFVVRELRLRGHPFLRLNTEDLAVGAATVALPDLRITVTKGGRAYDLDGGVGAVWYRRPGRPFDGLPPAERPAPATQQFIDDQWAAWLECLSLLPSATWINHPRANDIAENKILQLHRAARLGFSVPPTLVSNDPAATVAWLRAHGERLVAKALYSPLIEEPGQDFFIFANEIGALTPEDVDTLPICPCIFQPSLTPKRDYRVTVVGDRVFTARVEATGGGPVPLDWRTQKEGLNFAPCDLPERVADLCRAYVREWGLLFGAIDLVEHAGEFVFLEINPNGEWGWLQKPAGLPIAEALCDLMVRLDSGRP